MAIDIDPRTLLAISVLALALTFRARDAALLKVLAVIGWLFIVLYSVQHYLP